MSAAQHTLGQVYVGSRWLSKINGKTVYVVLERKPFGILEVQKEGRLQFGSTTTKQLRENFTPLPAAKVKGGAL